MAGEGESVRREEVEVVEGAGGGRRERWGEGAG